MRDGKLDFFKGFLIWSVVIGHTLNAICPSEYYLHSILRTFDLPMFMYISGFLLKGSIVRYHWKQLILNKITNIVVPALVWMCVSFIFGDRCMYYFLWAVFASSAIICISETISPKPWISLGLILGALLFFHIIPQNIVNMSFLFPFFVIGYYTENIVRVGKIKGWGSLSLFVFLFLFVWQADYSIWNSGGFILHNTLYMTRVVLVRLTIGLAGIYAVTYLFGALYNRYKDQCLLKYFVGIGKETLSIYLVQHIIVEILLAKGIEASCLKSFLADKQLLSGYVLSPIVSFTLLFLMYGVVILIQKSKHTKWVFGFRITLQ